MSSAPLTVIVDPRKVAIDRGRDRPFRLGNQYPPLVNQGAVVYLPLLAEGGDTSKTTRVIADIFITWPIYRKQAEHRQETKNEKKEHRR